MNLHFTPLPIRQIKRTNEISQVKGDEPHRTLEQEHSTPTLSHTLHQREKSLDLRGFFTFYSWLYVQGRKKDEKDETDGEMTI